MNIKRHMLISFILFVGELKKEKNEIVRLGNEIIVF
jgi:hypothetical protein